VTSPRLEQQGIETNIIIYKRGGYFGCWEGKGKGMVSNLERKDSSLSRSQFILHTMFQNLLSQFQSQSEFVSLSDATSLRWCISQHRQNPAPGQRSPYNER
jgi:hypothetical protein